MCVLIVCRPIDLIVASRQVYPFVLSHNCFNSCLKIGFVKHFRLNISDIKIERRFDDSMSKGYGAIAHEAKP